MICIIVIFFCHLPRQEAAGALWNLSFDDRNREAIALVGGVEALVYLFNHPVSFFASPVTKILRIHFSFSLWMLYLQIFCNDASVI